MDYIIMPNHIHILLWIKGEENGPSGTPVPTEQNTITARFLSTFKRFCNKEYSKNIWQYRSNDHIIRNREDYEEHIKYIYENPARWYYDELYSEE
jgi:REP element-mobilizing transposase RayT